MVKAKLTLICLLTIFISLTTDAKKYKWEYDRSVEVYTTGQGSNRTQIVKAWAVAGNADKAIDKAKMDAVSAALFKGIPFDASTHGMGVSNLQPLVTPEQYKSNEAVFKEFFKKGMFLYYVRTVNSSYPTGENNMKVPGGRRVGVNLVIDYPGLRNFLKKFGICKDLDSYFKN